MAKKHHTQLTGLEKTAIKAFVKMHLHKITGKPHFWSRILERYISFAEAKAAVHHGQVIEIHNEHAPDVRVLFRDERGICVPVSLMDFHMATAYYNDPDYDHHYGMSMAAYQWTVDVIKLLRGLPAPTPTQ